MKKIIVLLFITVLVFTGCNSSKNAKSAYYEIQDMKIDRIMDDFHENNRSFTTAYKILNPLDTNALSAYIMFTTDSPITYEYTVKGKTKNADFTHVEDEAITGDVVIPVVGLYADYINQVDVTITNDKGDTQTETFEFDTTPLYIPKELQKADVSINSKEYNKFMKDKWMINSSSTAYDINGDLRAYGLVTEGNQPMNFVKPVNGKYFVVTNDIDGKYYGDVLYEVDMMGRILGEIVAPEGIGFHHDMTYDGEYYYVLGSYQPAAEDQYLESLIVKYDSSFNYVDTIDLGDFFTGEENVLANTDKNDIHFNSINYLETENQLIISSRSTSDIFAYDLDTNSFDWILGEEEYETNENFKNLYLKGVDEDNDKMFSGQHSAIIVSGERVADYKDGQYLLALYDNRSCEDKDYNNVWKKLKDDIAIKGGIDGANSDVCAQLNSSFKTFKIDLNARTFDMIDSVELEGRNSYVSNINQFGEYFVVGSPLTGKITVYDNQFTLLGSIEYPTPLSGGKFSTPYRASVISEDDINSWL